MSSIYPYAGFWKRAIACIIDSFVLAIPNIAIAGGILVPQVISFVRLASSQTEPTPDIMLPLMTKWMLGMVLLWVVGIVSFWLYYALMESSKYQASLGKMALGIKVVGANGEKISFGRATGRTFAKFISHMILYFGDYMAGFTEKRQGLHDLMCATYVVDKNYQEGQALPALPFSKGGCAASIVAAIAPIALYILLILASIVMAVVADAPAQHNTTQLPTAPITRNV